VDANPHIDPWEPKEGTELVIPRQFILPPGPHDGITVNLAELRLYYFSPDGKTVTTSPIGIGSELTPTPIVDGKVIGKTKHPSWYVPDSIMEEHEERGDSLDRVVPPGPDNPLGDYKLTLSIPGYLIHGTNHSSGIGRRLTHGCMRMYPNDIEYLFNHVAINTPVHIIHAPVKYAWVDGTFYVEMHQPLAEYEEGKTDLVKELMNMIDKNGPTNPFNVDWANVKQMSKYPNGIPTAVGGIGAKANNMGNEAVVSSPEPDMVKETAPVAQAAENSDSDQ
jgi:L,D-transpeptidase ErfK/SrfK